MAVLWAFRAFHDGKNKLEYKMTKKPLLAALVGMTSIPAYAHHPLDGMAMETFTQGALSGVGHPILGFDHMFFVVLVGIAAAYSGYQRSAPLAYITAMAVGCLMMSLGVALPMKEMIIGLSLVIVGSFVLSGKALSLPMAAVLFAGFGLFHGSAFGDTIATQEAAAGASVLVGYLIGLCVVQYIIALVAGLAMTQVWKALDASALAPRIVGAAVAGAGMFLTLENLEGLALAALGWSV